VQRRRATEERLGRKLAVRHGTVCLTGSRQFVSFLEQVLCAHVGHVGRKVGLRWAGGERTAGERVNGSRTFEVMARYWRTLTDRCHNGHSYVLAWPKSNCEGKALMDDIEGILVVVSLYLDGGRG
jgi:hypothetical protein